MPTANSKAPTPDQIEAEQRALADAQQKTSEKISGQTVDEKTAHERLDARLTDPSGDSLSETQKAFLEYKGHRPGSDAYVRSALNPMSLTGNAEFAAFRAGRESAGGKLAAEDYNAQYELMVAVHGRNEAMGPPSTVTTFGVPRRIVDGDVVTSASPADIAQARAGVNPKASAGEVEQTAAE